MNNCDIIAIFAYTFLHNSGREDWLVRLGGGRFPGKLCQDKHKMVTADSSQPTAKAATCFKMKPLKQDNSNCCIICVGSTGTGKSSTVGKYTRVQTKAGSGTERVTKNCEIHRSLTDDQEPVWVDTVGWDDAECEDDQTFKDILKFINKYDITKVNNILTFILS